MGLTNALIDASFLFALLNPRANKHNDCLRVVRSGRYRFFTPDVSLPETAFLFRSNREDDGTLIFMEALDLFRPALVPLVDPDLALATMIATKYPHFDFVDCCIMAQAERLNITHVCTLDLRDFMQYRPRHIGFLTLLPAMASS